jgi:hypothetical protein
MSQQQFKYIELYVCKITINCEKNNYDCLYHIVVE